MQQIRTILRCDDSLKHLLSALGPQKCRLTNNSKALGRVRQSTFNSAYEEFEQIPGDSEGQGSPACYSLWGHKESDTTSRLNNNGLMH